MLSNIMTTTSFISLFLSRRKEYRRRERSIKEGEEEERAVE